MKKNRKFNLYQKEKNSPAEMVEIHWEDLHFLNSWKSLAPNDLMDCLFQFECEEWITGWVQPKKLKDYHELHNPQSLEELLHQTFDDTLEGWEKDTKGFTVNIPERYAFTLKNQNKFLSIMKEELGEQWEENEQETRTLMNSDKKEWFSVVFADTISEMVQVLIPYVLQFVKEHSLIHES